MATTSELRDLDREHTALVFLIDGLPYAWATHDDLVGTTWSGANRTILPGLRFPAELPVEIDPFDGQFVDQPISIEIDDFDDVMPTIFRTSDSSEAPLAQNIGAGEDLSARTDLHGKHVGTEAIGSSGERHRFPCIHGWTTGQEHVADHPKLAPPPVSDNPLLFRGRKCSIYRVYRDVISHPGPDDESTYSQWRPFSDSLLIWTGTLSDSGRVRGKTWTLDAEGWESWLRKPLATLWTREPQRVVADLSLLDAERYIGIGLYAADDLYPAPVPAKYCGLLELGTTQVSASDIVTIRSEISSHIDTTKAAAGPDTGGVFNSDANAVDGNSNVRFDPDSGEVLIRRLTSTVNRAAVMYLILHEKVWKALGYDPVYQKSLSRPGPDGDVLYVDFREPQSAGGFRLPASTGGAVVSKIWTPPTDRYWVAIFSTMPVDGYGQNNDGNWRAYFPRFRGGVSSLYGDLNAGAGQVVRLGWNSVYQPGQLNRPPASDPDDSASGYTLPSAGTVDAQGLWLFKGVRKLAEDADEFDEYQVARCSWAASGGNLINGDEGAELLIEAWLDPRNYGFDRPPLTGVWNARISHEENRVEAVPLVHLGYKSAGFLEEAHVVMQRILYTTGTSTGWTGYDGGASTTLDIGDNEPGFAIVPRDAEIADLGLGIPGELIHGVYEWGVEANKLPGDELRAVKMAYVGSVQSDRVLEALMRPLGWSWHLRDGKFGIFSPFEPINPDEIATTLRLTTADIVGTPDAPELDLPNQEIRSESPIDRFVWDYDHDPLEGETTKTHELDSQDRGFRYRGGGSEWKAKADGWRRKPPGGLHSLAGEIAAFWERRHFPIQVTVLRRKGQYMWPGTRVLLSNEWVVGDNGYGVTDALGLVLSRREIPTSAEEGRVYECTILVEPEGLSTSIRLRAPTAEAFGYDSANLRIYCRDNHLGMSAETWADVDFFVEPWWSSVGGDAEVKGLQWVNGSWSETWQGTVSSKSSETSGQHYLQLSGAITGKYYRDSPCLVVFREYTSQGAAWVKALYSPICDENGEFDDGTGKVSGYPWVS